MQGQFPGAGECIQRHLWIYEGNNCSKSMGDVLRMYV
jgi:hypothetical protein